MLSTYVLVQSIFNTNNNEMALPQTYPRARRTSSVLSAIHTMNICIYERTCCLIVGDKCLSGYGPFSPAELLLFSAGRSLINYQCHLILSSSFYGSLRSLYVMPFPARG